MVSGGGQAQGWRSNVTDRAPSAFHRRTPSRRGLAVAAGPPSRSLGPPAGAFGPMGAIAVATRDSATSSARLMTRGMGKAGESADTAQIAQQTERWSREGVGLGWTRARALAGGGKARERQAIAPRSSGVYAWTNKPDAAGRLLGRHAPRFQCASGPYRPEDIRRQAAAPAALALFRRRRGRWEKPAAPGPKWVILHRKPSRAGRGAECLGGTAPLASRTRPGSVVRRRRTPPRRAQPLRGALRAFRFPVVPERALGSCAWNGGHRDDPAPGILLKNIVKRFYWAALQSPPRLPSTQHTPTGASARRRASRWRTLSLDG